MLSEKSSLRRPKLGALLRSDINILNNQEILDHEFVHHRPSSASIPSPPLYDTPTASPYVFSPWNQAVSPFTKSPWIEPSSFNPSKQPGLIGSLVREEGHIYSLAASGNLLYTGSNSKNIHVWKNLMEFSGFRSHSGLVKAIIVSGNKIFTGHQDGKIRVWKSRQKQKRVYKRIGNLPTTKDYIKSSMNPKNYVEVRRHRNVPWIKHFDAVSCLSLDEEQGILYSGSWDKSVKVWRLSDFKCLESVNAHDDAVNSVAATYGGLIFTGSADGTVKVWRREFVGKVTRHVLVQTLLSQENAVTAVAAAGAVVYAGASDGLVSYWLQEKQSLSYGGALRGHKLTVLTGHTGPVKCLAIEEDHEEEEGIRANGDDDQRWRLYSGSLDKSVKVWRLSEQPHVSKQFSGK